MEIPDKIFFKIGEVSEIAGVKPYVLRYWETEFSIVPHKSGSGQRLYRRKDIEKILLIKRLLYSEGFTIAGARKHLAKLGRNAQDPALDGAELEVERDTSDPEPEDLVAQALEDERTEELTPPPEDAIDLDSRPTVDAAWLDALRTEVRELQAMIRAAREQKVS